MRATPFLLAAILAIMPMTTAGSLPLFGEVGDPFVEHPSDPECTYDNALCASMRLDLDVACGVAANGSATCSYGYGFSAGGWANDPLEGWSWGEVDIEVEACSSLRGCERVVWLWDDWDCFFVATMVCVTERGAGDLTYTSPVLVPGECVTLRLDPNAYTVSVRYYTYGHYDMAVDSEYNAASSQACAS